MSIYSARTAHMLEPTCSDMPLPVLLDGRQLDAQAVRECDRADLVAVNLLHGRQDVASVQARLAVDERLVEDEAAKRERMPRLEVRDQPGFHLAD